MFQDHSRRQFLLWAAAISAAVTTAARQASAAPLRDPQSSKPPPPPIAPPSDAPDPNPPTRTNPRRDASQGVVTAPEPDPKTVLKANDKDIKQNVEKLATLADELKKEVEATDSASVLSLGMVHKAEEIEKLARKIASLARG